MVIEINAIDTLFFRDGKPFSMGDETWADGMFPPNPTVIRGALRSFYFSNHQDQFKAFRNGGPDPTDSLCINGMAIRKGEKSNISDLLPAPNDLVITNQDLKNAELLSLVNDSGTTSSPLRSLFTYQGDEKVTAIESAYLDKSSFERYLKLQGDFQYISAEEIVTSEPKVGIGRDNSTLTTEEGLLYRVDMKRLQTFFGQDMSSVSLLVDFDNLELPESGLLKLGGENKVVSYHITEPFLPKNQIALNENNCFKVILLTPAIFDKGWKANWMEKAGEMKKRFGNIEIELVAAAIGSKQAVGGFDMKSKRDKPTVYAVPAGSVYIFRVLNDNLGHNIVESKLAEAFKSPVSDDPDYRKQGFGVAVVGRAQ